MSMSERIAHAALHAVRDYNTGKLDFDGMGHAIIGAMREPTEGMLDAAYGMCGESRGSSAALLRVWQTMIGAAQ